MSGSDWVITGIGLVSAGGDSAEALHRALCDAMPLPRDDDDARLPSVPIADFNVKEYIQRRGLKDLSRTSQLACAAASALAPGLEAEEPADVGVVLGTGWGSLRTVVDFEWEACTNKPRFLDPLLFAETVSNVPAGQIAILNGWSGFSLTVSCGPASGLEAIREAVVLLEEGRTPMAIAGGADELNLPALRVLRADGLLAGSPESLPFGRDRSGIVGGEGACLLLIESAEHARGAGRCAPPSADSPAIPRHGAMPPRATSPTCCARCSKPEGSEPRKSTWWWSPPTGPCATTATRQPPSTMSSAPAPPSCLRRRSSARPGEPQDRSPPPPPSSACGRRRCRGARRPSISIPDSRNWTSPPRRGGVPCATPSCSPGAARATCPPY